MSLSGIIYHSHSFTRLETYHHIYFSSYLVGGIHTVQVRIKSVIVPFKNNLEVTTIFFFRKNDIFLDLVPRKTVSSHKMVMFPFAECSVHCLDSS